MSDQPTRRSFLTTAGLASLGAALAPEADPASAADSPRDLKPAAADLGSLFPEVEKLAGTGDFSLSFLTGKFRTLDDFRATARDKLLDLLLYRPEKVEPRAEVLERVERPDHVREKVLFSTSPQFRVPAYVLIPKDLKGPAPAIVDLHLHGGMFLFGKEKVIDLGDNHPAMTTSYDWEDSSTETLTSSAASDPFNSSLTFNVTVTGSGGGTPTGSVAFYDGSTQLGTATLDANATAAFTTTTLQAGSHTVTAVYSGDTTFASSTSSLTETITQATPTVTVSDVGGIFDGTSCAASATVAGVVAGVDDSPSEVLEGTGLTLDYQQRNSDGSCTDLGSTAPTTVGNYVVTASFAGSTDYTSASQSLNFTISSGSYAVAPQGDALGYPVAPLRGGKQQPRRGATG